MTDIEGSRALITGAASGIGRLLAIELGRAGASLVLWDVDEQWLNEVQTGLQGAGRDVRSCVCDLTRRADIEAAAGRTLAECGPVDILINNAGIVSGKSLLEITPGADGFLQRQPQHG